MLRIEWDKKDLKEVINNYPGNYTILDYWIPLWVYIDDIEISGLKDIPGGDVTHIRSFFPEILSVIKIFDWGNLGRIEFSFNRMNPQENDVTGGGFKFALTYNNLEDKLTVSYTNKGITRWQKIEIPLKDYTEGALKAVNEIISDIEQIAPESSSDGELIWLKVNYNTIRGWYEERYHEPIEEKYVIPQRFF
nr:hypothetical protein [uncultured Methanoregula sp.]